MQQNWSEGSDRKCSGLVGSLEGKLFVGPINCKWLPRSLMALTFLGSFYLVLECLLDEMSSVLISSGEPGRISAPSAWAQSRCCRLSLSQMPHCANEVSRIYKMGECSANLRNLRAMIIQKWLIIHALCNEFHSFFGELKTLHFWSSSYVPNIQALIISTMLHIFPIW